MRKITIEFQEGDRHQYHQVTTVYLDDRIFCPHCGVKGQTWIDENAYEDNAGDMSICIGCGYLAYGLEWGEEFVPHEYSTRIAAIKEQVNAG